MRHRRIERQRHSETTAEALRAEGGASGTARAGRRHSSRASFTERRESGRPAPPARPVAPLEEGPGSGGLRDDAGPLRFPSRPDSESDHEQMQRATMIHDTVSCRARQCLDSLEDRLTTSSGAGVRRSKIAACEMDSLTKRQARGACDDEWQQPLMRAGQTLNACQGPACSEHDGNLRRRKNACTNAREQTWKPVHGAKARCDYSVSGTLGGCEVACTLGNYNFSSLCGGPAGLPLQCSCLVNGQELGIFDWQPTIFYASNCAEAAQRFADGEWCINRLDCCLEWIEGSEKRCECGSDTGCARIAQERGATRVDKCPQYDDFIH